MARDIFIFTAAEPAMPIDDIVSAMRTRGHAVSWHYRRLSERRQPGIWTGGYFTREQDATPLVSLSTRPVEPAELEETLEEYAALLDGTRRATLAQALREYRIVPESAGEPSAALSIHLADIIAGHSSGLVLDSAAKRFHDRDELRRAHKRLLGG